MRTAHREKALGIWRSYSWSDFLDSARAIGMGLVALGLKRGEVVSILSEDNKEWIYADLGVQCVGGIVTGVYPTDSAEQVAYLLGNSGSRFLIVENDEQLDKFLEIRDRVPDVATCIVVDRDGLQEFSDEQVVFLDELCEIGRKAHDEDPGRFERDVAASRPADIAILIYTSGTTGRPKGAMISHGNIMSSASSALRVMPMHEGGQQLCFLPLSHVLERLISVFTPIAAKSVVNFAESMETVFDNLREVSPASFTAVPRVWEKIHSRISMLAQGASPVGRWAFERAVACGMKRADYLMEGRRVPLGLEVRFRIWDLVVFANLRRMIGLDRARYIATGAAPISPDLREMVLGDRTGHAAGLRADGELRRPVGQSAGPEQDRLHRLRGPRRGDEDRGEWRNTREGSPSYSVATGTTRRRRRRPYATNGYVPAISDALTMTAFSGSPDAPKISLLLLLARMSLRRRSRTK